MTTGFTIALVVGSGLFFPVLHAMRVTINAFKTSPMLELTTVGKRAVAFWILLALAIYTIVVGYNLLNTRLPMNAGYVWEPILFVVGLGPLAWWFVSRQAHAEFDETTTVPAFTMKWVLRRSVRQYLRDQPDGHLGVGAYDGTLRMSWTVPGESIQKTEFVFDTRDEAARFWASLYALDPDTDQVCRFAFTPAESGGKPRARLEMKD